jgi:hypothetical protein
MEEVKKPNKAGLVILIIAFFLGGFCLGMVFDKEVLSKNKCKDEPKTQEEAKKEEETKKEEEPKEPEKPEEGQQPSQPSQPTQPTQPGSGERLSKKDTIIKIYKEEAKKSGLLKEDLIADISYNVIYNGYYSDKPNVKYYTVYGKFKCTKLETGYNYPTCVYQEQLADPDANGYYDWAMALYFDETDGRFDYKGMGSHWSDYLETAVNINQELQ